MSALDDFFNSRNDPKWDRSRSPSRGRRAGSHAPSHTSRDTPQRDTPQRRRDSPPPQIRERSPMRRVHQSRPREDGHRPSQGGGNSRDIPKAFSEDGGIEIMLLGLCDNVESVTPVVRFVDAEARDVKSLKSHAAWMLQTILESTSRADALYDFIEQDDIEQAVSDLGISGPDVSILQLSDSRYPPYKAVGANGVHSAILALLIRFLAAEKTKNIPRDFWEQTKPYGLDKTLENLLQQLRRIILRSVSGAANCDSLPVAPPPTRLIPGVHTRSSRPSKGASSHMGERAEPKRMPKKGRLKPATSRLSPGVEIWIINEVVPVVNMSDTTLFCEHVSWLIQTAMGSEKKAKDLTTYVGDFGSSPDIKKTFREFQDKVGMTEQDCGMVTLKGFGSQILAVGAAGKRSSMLAAVIAIALQDDNHLIDLHGQIARSMPDLVEPFFDLIQCAVELQQREYPPRGIGSGLKIKLRERSR